MGIPNNVIAVTVDARPGYTQGVVTQIQLSVMPTENPTWQANGQTLASMCNTSPAPGQILLPAVDQAGFVDQNHVGVTGWSYIITATWTDSTGVTGTEQGTVQVFSNQTVDYLTSVGAALQQPATYPIGGIAISGWVDTYAHLPAGLTAANAGAAYMVQADERMYVWSGSAWPARGQGFAVSGPAGPPETSWHLSPSNILTRQIYPTASAPTITFQTGGNSLITGGDVTAYRDVVAQNAISVFNGCNLIHPSGTYPFSITYRAICRQQDVNGSNSKPFSIHFYSDSPKVEIVYVNRGGTAFRVWVNDMAIGSLTPTTKTTTGVFESILIDSTSVGGAAPRRYRIDLAGADFGGIILSSALYSVSPAEQRGPTAFFFGDSLFGGSGMSTSYVAQIPEYIGTLYGWDNVWNLGIGGSGYVTKNAPAGFDNSALAQIEYVAPSTATPSTTAPGASVPTPDLVVIAYGHNDTMNTATYNAAAAVFTQARAQWPDAYIVAMGPLGNGTSGTSYVAGENAIFALVSGIADTTLSMWQGPDRPWMFGTGYAGNTTGVSNGDIYIGTDSIHWNDSGIAFMAGRIASDLRETLSSFETLGRLTVGPRGLPGPSGAAGSASTWRVASGVPSSGLGNNGDMALNSATGDVYGPKTSGSWGSVVENITGSGAAAATSSTLGTVQLAGDISGTATAPTVPTKVDKLVPTALKTTAYTAAVNDLVLVNAVGGAVTITLPTAPPDKARIALKKMDTSTNVVTMQCGGSDVFDVAGGSASGTLKLPYQAAMLQYQASAALWLVTSGDAPIGQLDARYAAIGTTISAGTGLTGGGDLSANRSLAVAYGTASGTATQGNDSRVVNAVQSTRQILSGTGLTGGGDLTADRTLAVSYGTAAGTAAQGNDSRIITGPAPLASPTFTGVPAGPTATAGTNTTQLATTAFVVASYAPLASPTFTGSPAAPTPTAGDSTTKLATTAFVAASYAPLASPALTGTPTAPTQTAGTSNTDIATTAFVAASFAPLASPALTGTPTVPTASTGTNTTQAASTAYVTANFARQTPRINTVASSATPAINTDTTDLFEITALTVNITSMTSSLTGTLVDGQKLLIRFHGAAAQTIVWGASYISSGTATLLAATVAGKTHLVGLIYDSAAGKLVCMACDATGY